MCTESELTDSGVEPETSETSEDWLRHAPASLVSLILHLVLLIILALFTLRSRDQERIVVTMGQGSPQTSLDLETITLESSDLDTPESLEQELAVEIPIEFVETGMDWSSLEEPGTNESGDALTSHSSPPLGDLSDEFERIVFDAQEHGIEIVIVFDSTGSMSSEINQVKQRIGAISRAVLTKIPQARFSLVTYRDRGDDYVVRGVPLNNDIVTITRFTGGVLADGGGDRPEALKDGMSWAMSQNDYRPYSRKAMLIFGDAPPHLHELDACLQIARNFRSQEKAVVHTISCRQFQPLHEFYWIANAGGGRAFVMSDVRGLMEELLVLAFGPEHREDVLKYFELDKPPVFEVPRQFRLPNLRMPWSL